VFEAVDVPGEPQETDEMTPASFPEDRIPYQVADVGEA
jgi:hypothetical protein